jgi:V8-like Glu-specific endopeptidase
VTSRSPNKAGAGISCATRGRRTRFLGVLIPLVLLAPAVDASASQASQLIVTKALDQGAAEVRDYWTPARMRGARPIEQRLHPAPARRTSTGAAQHPRRTAEPADSSTYPGRTHGKVFFTIRGFGDFLCSATVVRSGGRNLVLTAGHCVYDDISRQFATNWMFAPGFRDGRKPFGEWVARHLATTAQWRSDADLRYDVGVAVVHRDPNGRGVQDAVGARPIAFGQPRDQFYRAFGYPAQGRFDGERLQRCDSPYRGADREFDPPRPMRIDCDMAGGSSGGGWVADGRLVVSVTSYGYEYLGEPVVCIVDPGLCPERDRLFGPYFGSAVRELYDANRGNAIRCGGRVVNHRGTGRPDRLVGTPGPDVIHGRGDDDLLRGRAGDDVICGGRGDDRIFGGRGNNRIFAGPGNDQVFVRTRGRNRIVAGEGRNRIRCGPGRDVVITNHRSRVHRSCNRVIRR